MENEGDYETSHQNTGTVFGGRVETMYMDDIILFAKNGKELETPIQNIQSRYRDGIWQRKMRHASKEKRETTHDRMNQTTKSRKNQNLQILGNIV